jgi:hypothetical protein
MERVRGNLREASTKSLAASSLNIQSSPFHTCKASESTAGTLPVEQAALASQLVDPYYDQGWVWLC